MSIQRPILAEADDGLAMAMIASSITPLLLMASDMSVVAASTSFCRAFQIDETDVRGRSLFCLGDCEWDVPQLRSLLKATVAGTAQVEAYAMDLTRQDQPVQHLTVNVRRLDFADGGRPRLLLAATDVTDARKTTAACQTVAREGQPAARGNDPLEGAWRPRRQ